jgi:hypothetical protein
MTLNQIQINHAFELWIEYSSDGQKDPITSNFAEDIQLDKNRRIIIPEINSTMQRFINGEIPLDDFKTKIDSLNKRNQYWGFSAINGQMFFNMTTKQSAATGLQDKFAVLLKDLLLVPSSVNSAKEKIAVFEDFIRDLSKFSADLRGAPKVGSIPFFISYFWQIQKPEVFPIYYTSMVNALKATDIWTPSGNVSDDYYNFFNLNYELQKALSDKFQHSFSLWEIEHALWNYNDKHGNPKPPPPPPGTPEKSKYYPLPEGYIPPIVSILPELAINDPDLNEKCQNAGKTIEKEFEERLAVIFGMLGFETELLGQGRGRVPDGIAVCDEFHYAIIYDGKVRQQPYTMGIDERAIREYILDQIERFRKRGIKTIYFMIISSAFTGDHDDAIRDLKIETNVSEVILVEIKSLLAMLEGKLRNPAINLGRDSIQKLLASSGILSESKVKKFLDL